MILRLLRLPYAIVGAVAAALVPPAIQLRAYLAMQDLANAASDRDGPERLAQAEEAVEVTEPCCTTCGPLCEAPDEVWAAFQRFKGKRW